MLTLLLLAAQAHDALVPVPRADVWWKSRHYAMANRVREGNVGLVFVGDSITHAFGGEPDTGEGFNNRGRATWDKYFAPRKPINLGISGDRTQHVLWRLDRYNLERLSPKACVVMIGTNNMGSNSPAQIAEGVAAVCERLREKMPKAKILLLAIFPRDKGASRLRAKVNETNGLLAPWAKSHGVTFVDIGRAFLDANGDIPADVMPDGLHPNEKGYDIWGKSMEPTLAKLLGERPIL